MTVTILDDFNLEKIVDSGQCFRVRRMNDNTFIFIRRDQALNIGQISESEYEVDCTVEAWDTIWSLYFDLPRNYAQARKLISEDDKALRQMAEFGKGIRILHQDPWEMLVTFIISQRKSIPAIKKAVENLCDLSGPRIAVSGHKLKGFPNPEAVLALSDTELESCGLGYRTGYVKNAAEQVCSGKIDLQALDDENDATLLAELKQIHGVGEKVANCVSLFSYGRVDCAPIDVWIKRIIDSVYSGGNPFLAYSKYAGIYQQFMFYYAKHNSPSEWCK